MKIWDPCDVYGWSSEFFYIWRTLLFLGHFSQIAVKIRVPTKICLQKSLTFHWLFPDQIPIFPDSEEETYNFCMASTTRHSHRLVLDFNKIVKFPDFFLTLDKIPWLWTKFHDFSLTFDTIPKFPDFSLTLEEFYFSLTFPWPVGTLCLCLL